MSNKSPFEIRADILAMARDYMDKQYAINLELTKQMVEAGQTTVEDFQKATQIYSTDELMKKAAEMYSFVTKKD
jgi:hypothetical protein